MDADDQISLDDDSDFDEDLNLGELDNVLDQMSAIKSFLRNIGFSNELPLLGLANRLMAIKDEEKAIEAIMQCLEESRIQTDENKRASIIANFRTLQPKQKSLPTIKQFLVKSFIIIFLHLNVQNNFCFNDFFVKCLVQYLQRVFQSIQIGKLSKCAKTSKTPPKRRGINLMNKI